MITGAVLWFINRAMERGVDVTGNIGCLIIITGSIDAIIFLGATYLFLSLK